MLPNMRGCCDTSDGVRRGVGRGWLRRLGPAAPAHQLEALVGRAGGRAAVGWLGWLRMAGSDGRNRCGRRQRGSLCTLRPALDGEGDVIALVLVQVLGGERNDLLLRSVAQLQRDGRRAGGQ